MGAWYVFACVGFYPVNPCAGEYVLGAPQLEKVTLNGRFTIFARNFSPANKYVKSISLNGKILTRPILRHSDILSGGTLIFEMTDVKPKLGSQQ